MTFADAKVNSAAGTPDAAKRWTAAQWIEGDHSMNGKILATTAALALFATGQAMAFQSTPAAPATPAVAEKAPDGTTPEERSNTARLNAEQASRAKQDNVTYEQEVSAAEQQVAHDQAEFAEETAAYEAEKARVAAMSAEERMKWEADVAACRAGDASRCAPPAPKPR